MMFPFGGRLDRKFCPYCLQEKGQVCILGILRTPDANGELAPKKDADGNHVLEYACEQCRRTIPDHLQFTEFHLITIVLTVIGPEKIKEGATALVQGIDVMQELKTDEPGIESLLQQMCGVCYVNEDGERPETAIVAVEEE